MKTLYVVHCIDTEGPLTEDIVDTFNRIKSIYNLDLEPTKKNLSLLQNKKININGLEDAVAETLKPSLLEYNNNWDQIDKMLNTCLSKNFREKMLDDFGSGWIYSWHCMDHINYKENPRQKDIGYGKIFNFYKEKLIKTKSLNDEINWHFHPRAINDDDLSCGTSYTNSYSSLNYLLCRRVIDDKWFPVVNRPGFHSERQDSHLFLEQWIPFDYANQSNDEINNQVDLNNHRFGDWNRASRSWRGYHPSHNDYQLKGECNRKIFRCLNVGTRFNNININHIDEAFKETEKYGKSILSFCNHDYRDISKDVEYMRNLLQIKKKEFPDIKLKFAGAQEAAIKLNGKISIRPEIKIEIKDNCLHINLVKGKIFGPQPFLALKHKSGNYYHDNLDIVLPEKSWSYIFDSQSFNLNELDSVGVGSAGNNGLYSVEVIKL